MKLYHYASASKGVFDALLTERARLSAKGEGVREKYPSYVDHVSFFFDPIPAAQIPEYYNKKGYQHPFWYDGHQIIEYTVDIASHRGDAFAYLLSSFLLQAPDLLKAYHDANVSEQDYAVLRDAVETQFKVRGSSVKELITCVTRFKAHLRHDYVLQGLKYLTQTTSKEDWEKNKHKYAPYIPHLMVYDSTGVFKIQSHRELTLGVPLKPAMLSW